MKQFLKKLDMYLDRKWKETCAVLFYVAGNKAEKDIDWINMQKNINEDKKNEN